MKMGLVISGTAHVGLLGFALFSVAAPRPLPVAAPEALPVELVSISSVTKATRGDLKGDAKAKPALRKSKVETPKPVAAQPAPRPPVEKAAAPKPPAPKPPAAKPKPEPKPVETAALPKPVTTTPVRPKPAPEPKAEAPKPVPVKPVKVKPAVADTPNVPEPAPKEPEAEAKPEKVEAKPEKVEPEKAEAKPDPKQTLPTNVATPKLRPRPPAPKPVRVAKAEAKPSKAEPTRSKADSKADAKSEADRIKALLDKRKEAGGGEKSTETASLGTAKGTALKMSASELDALKGQIRACWNVQGGGADADSLRAKVSFKLDRSGNVVSNPLAAGTGGDSARARRAFAASALRAVKRCAPYNLPAEKYETWADVTVNFSLADML